MAIDSQTRASRRNILGAALGGLGGLLAGRLGSPGSARAADGGNAILGQLNTSTTETSFQNTDAGETSLGAIHTSGTAIRATGQTALLTSGKLVFSGRSGHKYVAAGHYYVDVAVNGMTSGADVIATLRTRKSGYYIAAVVSYAGKFRLYLNKTTSTAIRFNYLVLN
jgi:hypothetical protein